METRDGHQWKRLRRGGRRGLLGDPKFVLARYKSVGTLDATFGVNGRAETGFTAGRGEAHGVAVQADGKIVVAGWTNSGGSKMVALARYLTH